MKKRDPTTNYPHIRSKKLIWVKYRKGGYNNAEIEGKE